MNGDCPGGYAHLIKPVVAIEGDIISVSKDGIFVNGKLIRNSQPNEKDSKGEILPILKTGIYPVKQGNIWLDSGYSQKSFDSRYFGAIPIDKGSQITSPIWTID